MRRKKPPAIKPRDLVIMASLAVFACAPSLSKIDFDSALKGRRPGLFVIQDNAQLPVGNGQTVVIRKKPFSLVFIQDTLRGVAVNVTPHREAMIRLLAGENPEGIPGLCGGCGFAENRGSPASSLEISDQGSNYWYFQSDTDTRFHTHSWRNGFHALGRSIRIFEVGDGKESIPVNKYPGDTLACCVISYRQDSTVGTIVPCQKLGFYLVFGKTQGVSGAIVPPVAPAAVAPPRADSLPPGQPSPAVSGFSLSIGKMAPHDGDCFQLVGLSERRDTIYNHTACANDFVRDSGGNFAARYEGLKKEGKYWLRFSDSSKNGYYLFEGKNIEDALK
jgi:hypothetical protein